MNTTPKSSHKTAERPSANAPAPDLLAAALDYMGRGWSIIPIRQGGKTPPAGVAWKRWQGERAGEDQLRAWLGRRNVGGIAIILGAVSGGMVCRDFDAEESYHAWTAAHPELSRSLPTVKTARGFHVYARAEGAAGIKHLGDGEFRAAGYCLLPPSLHPSGWRYSWIVPPPPDDLPQIDLASSGFLQRWDETERAEVDRGVRSEPQAILGNGGIAHSVDCVDSAHSVPSVLSVPRGMGERDAETVEAAIRATLPTHEGERNRRLFDLARRLKAIPSLTDGPPDALKAILMAWHGRALPFITTKPFEESWLDFVRGWRAVLFPVGAGPMAEVVAQARESPPPACALGFEQEGIRLLAGICRELQRAAGEGPFFLGCRTAGECLGVPHTTAWRWLSLLEIERILKVVSIGDAKTRSASRYRYLGD